MSTRHRVGAGRTMSFFLTDTLRLAPARSPSPTVSAIREYRLQADSAQPLLAATAAPFKISHDHSAPLPSSAPLAVTLRPLAVLTAAAWRARHRKSKPTLLYWPGGRHDSAQIHHCRERKSLTTFPSWPGVSPGTASTGRTSSTTNGRLRKSRRHGIRSPSGSGPGFRLTFAVTVSAKASFTSLNADEAPTTLPGLAEKSGDSFDLPNRARWRRSCGVR